MDGPAPGVTGTGRAKPGWAGLDWPSRTGLDWGGTRLNRAELSHNSGNLYARIRRAAK